jgi:hypothetical protein
MEALSSLPRIVEAAAGQASQARQAGRPAAPFASSALAPDFDELMARAFAILAEETEAWRARRAANLPPGSTK